MPSVHYLYSLNLMKTQASVMSLCLRVWDVMTNLWCADLDPVGFHGVEVLTMYGYYRGVTGKLS